MEPHAEALIRATIHDLANCLSGAQGILDLSDPSRPLGAMERSRLESVLSDGMTVLSRARNLALESLPATTHERGPEWRSVLSRMLGPLSPIFRTSFELVYEGEPNLDRWPGEMGKEFVHAVTRVLMPYARGGSLRIRFEADPSEWRVIWEGLGTLAESLDPKAQRPRDITARWALLLAETLSSRFRVERGSVVAAIPRF